MKFAAIAVVAVLTASPAWAATWTVDPAHSKLGFSGTQTGTAFAGTFKTFTATIDFDPAHPEAGHVVAVIDMGSAVTGDTQRDEALPQADWFNIKAFPQAKFEATGFRAKGGNAFEAPGKLTIRGVSVDVVLPFTLDVTGGKAHAKGHAQLLRSAFGVGQGPWSTDQWVAFEVGVDVDLTATRAGS